MTSLRILYVSHSFPLPGRPLSNVGGMQRMAQGLHAALDQHPGVQLSSLLLETSWKATPYRMPRYLAGLLHRIPQVVEREGIEVVLFSSMVTASLATALGGRIRQRGALSAAIPVGRDVTLPTPGYGLLVKRVFSALDLILPISRATARECRIRGAPEEKLHVIPCGVDPDRFSPPSSRPRAREELLRTLGATQGPLPEGALLLCSVGRHQERKGFHWFVDQVMPRLPPDVHYLLSGEGPMTAAIGEAIRKHGLEGRVRMLGKLSEEALGVLYRGADLFVMPNIPVAGDIEGFGVVMLEAGLCGLPVLAADIEGIRDVVREDENGHLLPGEDAEAFAGAILRYLRDRETLPSASARAACYVEAHYTWPTVTERYLEYFREARRQISSLPGYRSAARESRS